jgi:uncharacterized protein (DUF2132 family)
MHLLSCSNVEPSADSLLGRLRKTTEDFREELSAFKVEHFPHTGRESQSLDFFLSVAQQPNWGLGRLVVSRSHRTRHTHPTLLL